MVSIGKLHGTCGKGCHYLAMVVVEKGDRLVESGIVERVADVRAWKKNRARGCKGEV